MAVCAQYGLMGTRQRKFRLVLGHRVGRRMKVGLRVAHLTTVCKRLRTKLCAMRIGVATLAGRGGQLVLGVGTGWLVAGLALNRLVFPLQLECALLMHIDGEERRLEPFFVVTSAAVAASLGLRELALVNVLMAIGAQNVSYGLTEITVRMAFETRNLGVFCE